LDAVILRALAKRPADRYPNAESMRLALVNAGIDTQEIFVVPPVDYANRPTAANRATPPPIPPRRPPVARREEPSRWPYAMALLVVAVAIIVVLGASLGNTLGLQGDDTSSTATEGVEGALVDTTATAESASPPTETPPPPTETPVPTPTETPVPPPTETPVPPTETPVPVPTETPVPPPTETPEPPPTETPVPPPPEPDVSEAVGAFLADVPANEPFNPERIPGEIEDGPVVETGRDGFVQGGAYRRPDGVLYGLPAAHLYSQTTDHPSTSVNLNLDESPDQYVILRIVGLDDELNSKVPLRITVNGYIVHDGPSPFGNATSDEGPWTDTGWLVGDLGAFQVGENTITIENRAPEGQFGRPPWILLSALRVYHD
jgi:hypothetical protein